MSTLVLPPDRPDAPNIMLGIPTYGDVVYDRLALLLLELGLKFQRAGFGLKVVCVGRTRIEKSRNIIASMFHSDPAFSHLLFIDSDMAFSADLITQMLRFDKPFIGVAAPSRRVSWDAIFRAAKTAKDADELAALGQRFIHQLDHPDNTGGKKDIAVTQGFTRAHAVGGGVLLLKREVFARIAAAYPDLAEPVDVEEKKRGVTEMWGFFNTLRPKPGAKIMAEDYAFSFRWREGCGGEIWCNVNAPITHYGGSAMTGKLEDHLAKGWMG